MPGSFEYLDARILVIDDELTNLKLLEKLLSANGYRNLQLVQDPLQALPSYQSCKADIILLDLQMPVKDGFALLADFQDLDDPLLPPIVVLTAYQQREYRLKALQAGAQDFLTKPFDHIELLARLNNLLAMHFHLCTVRRQKAILEQENQLAQSLYNKLLGNTGLKLPGISCFLRPASLFSGDILLAEVNSAANAGYILLADAMGHGLAAAISLIPISMLFHTAVEKNSSLSELVTMLNTQLNSLLPDDRFVAAVVVRCDFANHSISVWNGGMPAALYVDPEREQVTAVSSEHMALGILPPALFESDVIHLPILSNEKLLLCSDGVTEATNAQGAEFSDWFAQSMHSLCCSKSPFELIKHSLASHIEGGELRDDICLAQIDLTRLQTACF